VAIYRFTFMMYWSAWWAVFTFLITCMI